MADTSLSTMLNLSLPVAGEAAPLFIAMAKEVAIPTFLYIVTQRWIRSYFKDGEHYQKHRAGWKRIMFAYNILLSIFSLVCFVVAFKTLKTYGLFNDDCFTLSRDKQWMQIVWLFYMSKYVEFADTFFLLVMNHPVTWLQYFHHIGAPMDMYLLWASGAESAWFFVGFNSAVHTVMYLYYAASVYRVKLLPKQAVTALQISQFVVGLYFLWKYAEMPCFRSNANLLWGVFWANNFYVGTVLVLFLHFFIVNYIFGKKKAVLKAESGAGAAKEVVAKKQE